MFNSKKSKSEIIPYATRVDVLTEIVTTIPINGKYYKLSRERPSYEDEPTKIAYEEPLVKNANGKNIYITPVTIHVFDEVTDKEMKQIILEVDHASYNDSPDARGRVYVDSMGDPNLSTWDDVMLSKADTKELIAQLTFATKLKE